MKGRFSSEKVLRHIPYERTEHGKILENGFRVVEGHEVVLRGVSRRDFRLGNTVLESNLPIWMFNYSSGEPHLRRKFV